MSVAYFLNFIKFFSSYLISYMSTMNLLHLKYIYHSLQTPENLEIELEILRDLCSMFEEMRDGLDPEFDNR